MKFIYRFAYYFVGLIMGLFFVSMVFSSKDTRCNYFPNARVLNDLRNKPFNYSKKATQILAQSWIDTIDINFDQSNIAVGKGKKYSIDGKTIKNQAITLTVINYADKVVLENIVRK
jgi:hypothetical protein